MSTGEFRMPSLGADMEVGTILEWKVAPGDTVHRGDIVAVVDTEKADIEVEVFEDGVVEELVVRAGQQVPVGALLARLAPAAAPSPGPRSEPAPEAAAGDTAVGRAVSKPSTREHARGSRRGQSKPSPTRAAPVRASPLARRRAHEQHLDLSSITGSGPGGAVLAADLEQVTPAQPLPTGRGNRPEAMRQAIAELMARSKREVPHYYLATTIELGDAMSWMATCNAERPVAQRLLPAALLLRATALAAREVPDLNGFWKGSLQRADHVHLGVAIGLRGGGLVAPAIHDADRLPLGDLMDALRDLVGRARAGRLRAAEMSDPTITVTNLGEQGAAEVFGVIYPPQVALVGFGKVVEQPWAAAGMLGVRPTVRATLAADHRATDGHVGSRLLTTIDHLLHTPEAL